MRAGILGFDRQGKANRSKRTGCVDAPAPTRILAPRRVEDLMLFQPLGTVLQVFHPDSPQARAILDLGVETGVVLAAIFAIVVGMVVYALVRFRGRSGEPDPPQQAGYRTLAGA